ncbi:hypothetical protein ACKI1Z_41365, partial [Streptomyces galilaeus]|uniref:hypothetical protein n=1 Tax=Streptomyces galilaeus TaxID=33899 RepID=UPI0038F7B49B
RAASTCKARACPGTTAEATTGCTSPGAGPATASAQGLTENIGQEIIHVRATAWCCARAAATATPKPVVAAEAFEAWRTRLAFGVDLAAIELA